MEFWDAIRICMINYDVLYLYDCISCIACGCLWTDLESWSPQYLQSWMKIFRWDEGLIHQQETRMVCSRLASKNGCLAGPKQQHDVTRVANDITFWGYRSTVNKWIVGMGMEGADVGMGVAIDGMSLEGLKGRNCKNRTCKQRNKGWVEGKSRWAILDELLDLHLNLDGSKLKSIKLLWIWKTVAGCLKIRTTEKRRPRWSPLNIPLVPAYRVLRIRGCSEHHFFLSIIAVVAAVAVVAVIPLISRGRGQGELQRSGLCCSHWGLHSRWRWLCEQPGIRLRRLWQQRTLPHCGERCSSHTVAGGEFLHWGVLGFGVSHSWLFATKEMGPSSPMTFIYI